MSSATNSHNYLCECWTRGVQSALADQFSDLQVSHRNRCKNRLHVVTSAQFPLFIFVLSVEAIYGRPCDLRHSELSQKLCREIAKIASHTVSHGSVSSLFQCRSTKRVRRDGSFCRASRLRGCHRRCSL